MNVEDQIVLNQFKLRPYQVPVFDAIENKETKRVVYVAARRSGKDILGWNLAIRQCIKRVCQVYYVLPTYGQARKAIWDAITIDGRKFLDFIPPQLIENMNQTEMKVRFTNGSLLQLIGGDSFSTSIVGSNPYAVILSEYSLMPPDIFSYISPILAANGGWCLIQGTPRGRNHFYHLYALAKELPEWKVFVHKTSEIHHVPQSILDQERAMMDEGTFLQEYECSFERGISGSYYGTYIDQLRLRGQIGPVAWEPGLLVHLSIDIGVNDATTLIWYQIVGEGTVIRVIDCHSNNGMGLDYYAKLIQDKPYRMGKMFAPADIKVREWGGGAVTRYEKARQLGLEFTLLDQIPIMDGIENVWTHFNKFWIDENKCKSLIHALEGYRREYDEKRGMYNEKPLKNWTCFTGDTLVLTRTGMRPIIDIKDNDYVLTREGWQPCTKSFMTRKNANLVEVKFNDGTKVRCTPDHMFLTVYGWRSAESLQKGSEIQLSSMYGRNISKEMYTDSIKVKTISRALVNDCIEKFGDQPLEIYPKELIYTMSMDIPATTISSTSFACLQKNIEVFQNRITQALEKLAERQQLNGINHQKVSNGIETKQDDVSHGNNGNENCAHVDSAEKISNVLLEVGVTPENIVIRTVKQLRVVSVEHLKETEDVYCITVPGYGEFSLANGAIVKNCHFADAFRYLCQSIHKTKKGMSREEFETKKAEALYGNNSMLPRILDPKFERYRQ